MEYVFSNPLIPKQKQICKSIKSRWQSLINGEYRTQSAAQLPWSQMCEMERHSNQWNLASKDSGVEFVSSSPSLPPQSSRWPPIRSPSCRPGPAAPRPPPPAESGWWNVPTSFLWSSTWKLFIPAWTQTVQLYSVRSGFNPVRLQRARETFNSRGRNWRFRHETTRDDFTTTS